MTITPNLQNMYKEMFKDYFSSRDKLKSEQKKIISKEPSLAIPKEIVID